MIWQISGEVDPLKVNNAVVPFCWEQPAFTPKNYKELNRLL